MKKMFMMMLLSIVSWTGAVTATEATAPLKSNGPVAQQEAVVAADMLSNGSIIYFFIKFIVSTSELLRHHPIRRNVDSLFLSSSNHIE